MSTMGLVSSFLMVVMVACGAVVATPEPFRGIIDSGGRFNDTCPDVRFFDPRDLKEKFNGASPYLVANCKRPGGLKERCTWMPLFACFANSGGHLVYRRYGSFHRSCNKCEYDHFTTVMKCLCKDKDEQVASSVSLNELLWNYEGQIRCHNYIGYEIECTETDMMKIRTATAPDPLPEDPELM
ncbi:hypothetical protein EsH8_II_000430 [Colletotrichum jinshuiense]